VRSIDRISVLIEVAGALNVPVTELSPDPLIQEGPDEHPAARAVRRVLTETATLDLVQESPRGRTPDLEELRVQAGRAWELTHASSYVELASLLPDLIMDSERATRRLTGDDRTAAFSLLADVYQATAAAMAKLRQVDVAWVVGDRSIEAAERAGEPLLAAAGVFRIAHAFLSGNRIEDALRTALAAADALEPQVATGAPELVALWGALNQVGAVIATRASEEDVARERMRKAEEAAARLGEDRNDFETEFGPTNVALHAVAVAVELGDAGEALRRAAPVDASRLSVERRGRFLLDVARAYAQRRKTAEAVRAIEEAEALTPEQVRSHPMVREMVRDLLRGERRRVNPELRRLAERVGVLPNPQS
jgi:tetratricopeptide (TPR) repeat protein